MKNLNEINEKLNEIKKKYEQEVELCETAKYELIKPTLDQDQDFQDALNSIQNFKNDGYMLNQYGELESWIRFDELKKYSDFKNQVQEYFFQEDPCCCRADFENDCLIMSHGDEFYYISEDNEVYLNSVCVVSPEEFTNEFGEVDEQLRNSLIEQNMELNGCFPEVVQGNDRDDEVFLINTNNKRGEK